MLYIIGLYIKRTSKMSRETESETCTHYYAYSQEHTCSFRQNHYFTKLSFQGRISFSQWLQVIRLTYKSLLAESIERRQLKPHDAQITMLTIQSLYQLACHYPKIHNNTVKVQSALEDIVSTGVLCNTTLLLQHVYYNLTRTVTILRTSPKITAMIFLLQFLQSAII